MIFLIGNSGGLEIFYTYYNIFAEIKQTINCIALKLVPSSSAYLLTIYHNKIAK